MTASAKLFMTGHSQAVRLPKEFRMPGDTVWIRRNEATGEVILTPVHPASRKERLDELFRLLDATTVPEDFMAERDNEPGKFRDIF